MVSKTYPQFLSAGGYERSAYDLACEVPNFPFTAAVLQVVQPCLCSRMTGESGVRAAQAIELRLQFGLNQLHRGDSAQLHLPSQATANRRDTGYGNQHHPPDVHYYYHSVLCHGPNRCCGWLCIVILPYVLNRVARRTMLSFELMS